LDQNEIRALSIASGGTVLPPTSWAKFIDNAMAQDAILSRVRRVETTTAFVQPIMTTPPAINTGVAEASLGATEADPAFLKPYQGTSGTTQYTFSLNKITSWLKVSNELLNDTKAAADIETYLRQELITGLMDEVNRQILMGAGSTECQGSFNSAKLYSRTASTTVATTNTIKDVISAAWLSSASTFSPLPYESWRNCVAVINSRTMASWDPSAFPILFPTMSGSMKEGTTYEGLPVVYHRLSTGTPTTGDTICHFFDPSKYLLATNLNGFSVARFDESLADNDQALFVATVRVDGSILHSSSVLNVNRS
jgi:HK97 family phage major capsid protein